MMSRTHLCMAFSLLIAPPALAQDAASKASTQPVRTGGRLKPLVKWFSVVGDQVDIYTELKPHPGGGFDIVSKYSFGASYYGFLCTNLGVLDAEGRLIALAVQKSRFGVAQGNGGGTTVGYRSTTFILTQWQTNQILTAELEHDKCLIPDFIRKNPTAEHVVDGDKNFFVPPVGSKYTPR